MSAHLNSNGRNLEMNIWEQNFSEYPQTERVNFEKKHTGNRIRFAI